MEVANSRKEESDSELELYTIPSSSKWFAWDEIHETEKTWFKNYFNGTSITRTPKIYKEYRDFIINKYREESSRRLTFTEVRKSLVGDVTFLYKVFQFLEYWGLINYGAASDGDCGEAEREHEEERCKLKVEDCAPNGIRVVATPNSLKPISLIRDTKDGNDVGGIGVKMAPIASYKDVYGDLMRRKELDCGNCGDKCGSGHYRCTKDNFIICTKCFENGNYGEKRSMEDFISNNSSDISTKHGAVWTEGETLLLLESVLKHGDDWDLVAQSVQNKTKLECISKLIELPFGELMLGSAHKNGNINSVTGIMNNGKQVQSSLSNHQETSVTQETPTAQKTPTVQDQSSEPKNVNEQNGDAVDESPSKRQRVAPLSDSSSSLMKQVGLLATVVDPHITAAAADAAITALCDESLLPREIFDVEEVTASCARALKGEGLEMVDGSTQSEVDVDCPKDDIPLTIRIRAAIGTALGATAARAKLLADQEDREIEHLVATIIEAQIGKLQEKVKHFDELELLMEKEHADIEELKDSILTERINVLRRTLRSGTTKWKDYPCIKS